MNLIDDLVMQLSKKRNTSVIKNPYLDPALANNLKAYLRAFSNHRTHAVRHPSYGSKAEFIAGLNQILD